MTANSNWAGLLFVVLVFPAAGMMTVGLRCWSLRAQEKKRDRKDVTTWREYFHMLRLGIGWSRRNLRREPVEPVWARKEGLRR